MMDCAAFFSFSSALVCTARQFMFWYKVSIHNEGIEPVQVVARAWDIEKMNGEKETVKGAGIMSSQPIIPAGEVFNYQSVCPLKFEHVPKGKRFLGAMSGAYTMAKGNMGQVGRQKEGRRPRVDSFFFALSRAVHCSPLCASTPSWSRWAVLNSSCPRKMPSTFTMGWCDRSNHLDTLVAGPPPSTFTQNEQEADEKLQRCS